MIGSPTGSFRAGPANAPATPDTFVMPSLGQELGEHVHNKLVHFPIVLSLTGLALLVGARRRPALEPAARALIWAAAAFAIAAFFAGRSQEAAFDDTPRQWLVELHERWGTFTAIGIVLWGIITAWKPARRFALPWGVLVVIAVLIVAFYGGVVSHGE
ncbi:MAG TPA: hypothetical protein VEY91_07790 [Candidatus Limnocylindria bacterium]|nr:hypothetical protein [Candidatus Limnocylindria bacterium]